MELIQSNDLREALAAERTFLAWIRTGLALMGFGFIVARFGVFLEQLTLIQHARSVSSYGLSLWFGTALIVVGVVVFVLFSMASYSSRPRVGSRRRSAFPSIHASCGNSAVLGLGRIYDGN
jgi:putative membrane protein